VIFVGNVVQDAGRKRDVEYVVVGIGINVNQRQFAADLASKATSLQLEGKGEIDRAILFRETLISLESHYTKVSSDGFDSVLPLWLGRTKMLNKPVSVLQQGETITGIMKGVSPEGGLVLLADGTEKVLTAPEATVIRM
jgi:BirA family biotin operon repressor/biotin-[acetyl-CoA-carboxylase] ligase